MKNLHFKILDNVFKLFPEIHVFAVRVEIEHQTQLNSKRDEMAQFMKHIRSSISIIDPLAQLPEISQWRSAYSQMGIRPSKFPSSIEALLRRLKNDNLSNTGIPLVDYYNTVSIVNRAPLGAYDINKLSEEQITLRTAEPNLDEFHPLGGKPDSFPLNPNLVVYSQGKSILCWGINTRDSSLYAVDNQSTSIVFLSETTTLNGISASRKAIT